MLFLTGNSNEGDFRVVQKTIYDRMNISEKTYYNARKALQEMGWIQYVETENVIYVNYDKIYADYRNYQEKKKAGSLYESPNSFSTKDSAVVKVLAEQSLYEQEHCFDDSQRDYQQDRYNNIKNNKTNTINKKISSGGAGAANAAPPQNDLIKQMREDDRKIYEWAQIELHRINTIFDYPCEPSKIEAMRSSDEYKQYLAELEKKRIPLRKKYGKLYEW